MKTFAAILATSLLSASAALAFQDGTYTCKNTGNVPATVYKIDSVSVNGNGPKVPYIDVTTYYLNRGPNAKIGKTHIFGYATVSEVEGDSTFLMLGAMHIEFAGDNLLNCDKTSRR